jgi:MbtH protein
VSNPFEHPDREYLVLLNDELQYSLWPAFADVPAGWRAVSGPASLDTMTAYVDEHWSDMRPKSLRDAKDA